MYRTVLILGLISLCADIASEMLYPVIPLYLTTVLGASMISLGIIEGFADGFASLLKVFFGVWSDRIGQRRSFIFLGYFISGLAKPLIGFASAWPTVFSVRLADRVGKGVRTAPRDALLADSVPAEFRARAFGWHRAMDTTGAVIGPLLALVLFPLFEKDLSQFFILALIPGVLAAFLVFFVPKSQLKTGKSEQKPAAKIKKDLAWSAFRNLIKNNPSTQGYLVLWLIFSIGNSSDAFLLLRSKGFGFSSEQMIGLYCLYNAIYAMSAPILGSIADRFSKQKVLQVSFVLFFLVYFGFAVAPSKEWIIVLFIIYGFFSAASEGIAKALIIDFVPADKKATGIGLLEMVRGFGVIIAGIWAGILWEWQGPSAPFFWGALMTSLALLLSQQVFKTEKKTSASF